MNNQVDNNYSKVTELPGQNISWEQSERLYQRYFFASRFCENKDVLEVACGGGPGLGMIARRARMVLGGDIDRNILELTGKHYRNHKTNIHLQRLDARHLPFADNSLDIVLMFEAIYYLSEPDKFLEETRRVLREKGMLIICTANREWIDFNPSPYSVKYLSASELHDRLKRKFSEVRLYGAFPVNQESPKDRIVSLVKRMALALNLIPKTMKGKELLKRIFFGRLLPMPAELKFGDSRYEAPRPINFDSFCSEYKVLYALGICRD